MSMIMMLNEICIKFIKITSIGFMDTTKIVEIDICNKEIPSFGPLPNRNWRIFSYLAQILVDYNNSFIFYKSIL